MLELSHLEEEQRVRREESRIEEAFGISCRRTFGGYGQFSGPDRSSRMGLLKRLRQLIMVFGMVCAQLRCAAMCCFSLNERPTSLSYMYCTRRKRKDDALLHVAWRG